jgi:hypothetical protein
MPRSGPHTVDSQPVDTRALAAALRLFADRFLVADKRKQVQQRLVTVERRADTLASLDRWLDGAPSPLAGAERSPAGLRARFGEMLGVHLDDDGARRTTIAGALELGRGRTSLFVSDNGRVALLTRADGPPLLCARL